MRVAIVLLMLFASVLSIGAQPDADGIEFFEKRIRPVLVAHCYKCHSVETGKKRGGLQLDTRDGIRKGGDSGPAIIPRKPAEGLLLKAVRQTNDDLKMPPTGKLSEKTIADLEAWIKMG